MKVSMFKKAAAAGAVAALLIAQPAMADVALTGGGSSFASPLFDACKADFATANKGLSVNYASSSSGTGRNNSDAGIGDFNFSDTPHTAATKKATVIHIPALAGAIGVMYNLAYPPRDGVNLSASTLAKIYAGTITMWNDDAIKADNNRTIKVPVYKKDANGLPVLKDGKPVLLSSRTVTSRWTPPTQKIVVIYRNDSSGTVGNFTAALNGIDSTDWPKAGNNSFVSSFPGGQAGLNSSANLGRIVGTSGSAGVAALAAKTPYSIAFAEKNFAIANKLGLAKISNQSGAFVAPEAEGVSSFLGEATVNADGTLAFSYKTTNVGAYILGITSYALVDTKTTNGKEVKTLLNYLLSPACAQKDPALGFALVSGKLLTTANAQIAKIGA
ncbi:MAG: substrate-binding domain-containing protein [Actinomycetes bacterium]